MAETRFIFDRLEKETEETVKQILEVVQKKPYPDKNTTILASFVHALFQTAPGIREISPAAAPKKEEVQLTEKKPLAPPPVYVPKKPVVMLPMQPAPVVQPAVIPPVAETGLLAKETTLLPEMPEPPSAVFKKQEYTISSFNTQVQVVLDTDETGKPAYKISEPLIKDSVLKLTKEYIEDDFEKDFKVLDNADYMNKKIEKACRKSDVAFTEEYAKAVIYFLKRDLLGFRRIDTLMYDNAITAIYCEGLNKPVLVEIKDIGKVPTNIIFTGMVDLNALLYRIAKATGNDLSETKPILDTEFQGHKIQAVLGIGGTSSKLIIKK
ncbi:MAG TPA: hypothetical protein HA362_05780 [Nanoarchaeota archaeon]|nr:hypothetical protein [Nanoarchaeota archaeon]